MPIEELHLVSGVVGPFYPQIPATVPLWLAVYLKKRNKCRLKAPDWLSRMKLEDLLQEEKQLGGDAFAVLPSPYFVEIATFLLEFGKESLAEVERVRLLIDSIIDLRKAKVMDGLSTLEGATVMVSLNNLTSCELNVLRPFMLKSLRHFDQLAAIEPRNDNNNL